MARLPGFIDVHPLQPQKTVQGALELMDRLGHWLKVLTGMPCVALSPKAGAHGELCGMMAIRAAVEGLGVIVMDRLLVERELSEGCLIDLFPDCRPVDNGYHFICETDRWHDPVIVAFRDWVVAAFDP